jgi:hypothetical protein
VTRRAVRTVLSSMLQMAWDEGYRDDNPLRTITLNKVPAKPVLVSSHAQWNRLEEVLPFHAALVYARLNVTTWARQCEMRTFRPCDFKFGATTMINITRSASYVTAENHPDAHAGWVVPGTRGNAAPVHARLARGSASAPMDTSCTGGFAFPLGSPLVSACLPVWLLRRKRRV